jgi:hypothetical protein
MVGTEGPDPSIDSYLSECNGGSYYDSLFKCELNISTFQFRNQTSQYLKTLTKSELLKTMKPRILASSFIRKYRRMMVGEKKFVDDLKSSLNTNFLNNSSKMVPSPTNEKNVIMLYLERWNNLVGLDIMSGRKVLDKSFPESHNLLNLRTVQANNFIMCFLSEREKIMPFKLFQ